MALRAALYDPVVDLQHVMKSEFGDLGSDGKPICEAPPVARQALDRINDTLDHVPAVELRGRIRERSRRAEAQAMPMPSPDQRHPEAEPRSAPRM